MSNDTSLQESLARIQNNTTIDKLATVMLHLLEEQVKNGERPIGQPAHGSSYAAAPGVY